MNKSVYLAWGIDANNRMQHIDSVERGKACGCFCPDCGIRLIAKKGEIMANHFAHASPTDCNGESALHRVAKQVLIDAAQNHELLCLPGLCHTESSKDLIEQVHDVSVNIDSVTSKLQTCKEEVTLRKDLRVDALINVEGKPYPIAVEIFVTNYKKDVDIKKFIEIEHSAIEIDLSYLEWNSNYKQIKEAVFNFEKSKWLHCIELKELKRKLKNDLDIHLENINNQLWDNLDNSIILVKKTNTLDSLKIIWPILSKYLSAPNAFGEQVASEISVVPKITSIKGNYRKERCGYICEAIAGKKAEVNIAFWMKGANTYIADIDKPTLLVQIPVTDSEIKFPIYPHVSWTGYWKWSQELEKRTKAKLESELEVFRKKKRVQNKYLENFYNLSDKQKMAHLTNKLGLNPPNWIGKIAPAWNTTWAVWKTAVWLYCIKKEGDLYRSSVSVSSVATDTWLQKMFGFSESEPAEEMRSKQLWFWFKDLQDKGYLMHSGYQNFTIYGGNIPDDFEPWVRLK